MRIRLSDLAPGVNYALQVRATDGSRYSDWSRVFNLLTTSDSVAPKTPTGVVGSMTGTSFNLSWNAVTQSSDNTAAMDLDHYEVLVASTGTATTKVYSTADTKFQFTFEMNRELFGTPRANIIMSVLARDKTGNPSAYSSTVSQTNPAPAAVTGLTAVGSVDNVTVSWNANTTDADLAEYEIWLSKTGSGGTYSKVGATPATSFNHQSSDYFTDHWYRVYSVDVFGTLSPATTIGSAVRPVGSFTVDTIAPATPTGLAGVLTTNADATNTYAIVTWTAVADPDNDLAGYRIGYRPVGATDWQYTDVDYTLTSTRIDRLIPYVNYELRIRAYDFSANFSGWSSTVTTSTAATNAAPPTPSTPTASSDAMRIQVVQANTKAAGGAMDADVVYYEVYASSTASGFVPADPTRLGEMQVGPAIIGTFNIPASAGSGTTQTWYVKTIAVDSGGLRSPASAHVTVTPGLIGTTNIGDAVITNAKVSDLAANKITAGTGFVNDLTVKSKFTLGDASNDGIIESYDYGTSGGTTGFRLAKSGLIIKTGSIEAAALKIQNSANMMPPAYADFEFAPAFYVGKMTSSSPMTKTLVAGGSRFGGQYLSCRNPTAATYDTYLGDSSADYNINVDAGAQYIVSAWVKGGPVTSNLQVRFRYDDGSLGGFFITTTVASGSGWTRYSGVSAAVPAGRTKAVLDFQCATATINAGWEIDGIQVEAKMTAETNPSPWTAPGMTAVDGGIIRTGEIRSTSNTTVGGVALPMWSINTQGSMQVGDGLIRGKLIVGASGETAQNRAPGNGDMETNVTGYTVYQLGATGTGIAQTTTVGEVISGTGSAKVSAAAGTKTRLGITISPTGTATGGTTITTQARVKVNTTDAGSAIRIAYWNPAIAVLFFQDVVASPVAGEVYDIDTTYTLDDGETLASISIYHAGTTLTTTSFIVDDVFVQFSSDQAESFVSSYNYSTGSTGWFIGGQGDVEFNSGVFRGTLGAGTVTAETFAGDLVISNKFIGGEVDGSRVEFGPQGVQLFDGTGSGAIIDFPTDITKTATFSGDLLANSLTVTDQMAVRGSQNELSRSATLTLQANTTSPNSPPTITVGLEALKTSLNLGDKFSGLAWDSGKSRMITAAQGFRRVTNGVSTILYAAITRFHPTTGAVDANVIRCSKVFDPLGGITVIGTTAYVLGLDYAQTTWWIEGRSLTTGALVMSSQYINGTSKYNPTIGNDGTNLLVAYMRTVDRKASVQTVNATTGAGISLLTVDTAFGAGYNDLSFVGKANYDYGASRILIARTGYNNVYVYDSAGVKLTGTSYQDFLSASGINGVWYGTVDAYASTFWTFDAETGKLYRHSPYNWAGSGITDNSTFWAANTWWDGSTAPAETFNVTNKALTSNVATLTTSTPHGLSVGNQVLVAGVDATFNGTYTLTVASGTTLSYAKTASNVTSVAASGTVGKTTTTHETPMSPLKKFTMNRRWSVTVNTAPIPLPSIPASGDDAKATRIYLAKGLSQPVAANMNRQVTLADGVRVGYLSHTQGTAINVPAAGGTGTNQPPTTNGFDSVPGNPSVIKTANSLFSLNGSGVGNWGDLSVSSLGVVTIAGQKMGGDTGWTSSAGFTAGATFTLTSYSVRKIGNMVNGYFVMTTTAGLGAGNIGNESVINIPAGYRTSQSNGVISGGPTGPGLGGYISSSDVISVTSTDGTVAAGGGFVLVATWMTD